MKKLLLAIFCTVSIFGRLPADTGDPHAKIEAEKAEISALEKASAGELEKLSSPLARVALAKKLMGVEYVFVYGRGLFSRLKVAIFDRENFPRGMEILKEEARKGNPYANLTLGELCRDGNDGVRVINAPLDIDKASAKKYFHEVLKADGGYLASLACLYLGEMALGNRDLTLLENEDEAVEMLSKSAELGNLAAVSLLNRLYTPNIGGYRDNYFSRQDEKEAFAWALKGAERDASLARYVADEYMGGNVVPKDAEKAGEYYLKAVSLSEGENDPGSVQNRVKAAETYARLCERNLLDGKSAKDAAQIRAGFDMADGDTFIALNMAMPIEALPPAGGSAHNRARPSVGKGKSWQASARVEKALNGAERLKALPESGDGKIQFAIGSLYFGAARMARAFRSMDAEEARKLCGLAAGHFENAAKLGVKEAALCLALEACDPASADYEGAGKLLEEILASGDDALACEILSSIAAWDTPIPNRKALFKKYSDRAPVFFRLYLNEIAKSGNYAEFCALVESNPEYAGLANRLAKGVLLLFGADGVPRDPEKTLEAFKPSAKDVKRAEPLCRLMTYHAYRVLDRTDDAAALAGTFKNARQIKEAASDADEVFGCLGWDFARGPRAGLAESVYILENGGSTRYPPSLPHVGRIP